MFDLAELHAEFKDDVAVALGPKSAAATVDALVVALSAEPLHIQSDEIWQGFRAALLDVSPNDEGTLVALTASSLDNLAMLAAEAKKEGDTQAFGGILEGLEKYAFVAHVLLVEADKTIAEVEKQPTARRAASASTIAGPANQASQLLGSLAGVVAVGLDALLPTSQARDTFASMYLQPAFRLLDKELVIRHKELRQHIFRVVSLGVKFQGQLPAVHMATMQLLNHYPHTADALAELLLVLKNEYDNTSLAALLLRDAGEREFTAQDLKGPKPLSAFLAQMARLLPGVVHQHIHQLLKLLDSPSTAIRISMLEVVGVVAVYQARLPVDAIEEPGQHARALDDLVDILLTHTNDAYSFCRSRALQGMLTLCLTPYLKKVYHKGFARYTSAKVGDRSSFVRHSAFKLLNVLLTNHPFSMAEGSQLTTTEWQERHDALEAQLETQMGQAERSLLLDSPTDADAEQTRDDEMVSTSSPREDSDHVAADEPLSSNGSAADGTSTKESNSSYQALSGSNLEILQKMQLMLQFHKDALAFIRELDTCLHAARHLLRSKNKTDVVDAMDFFVLADAFGLESSRQGIREMVHLVWAKASNDEKDTIQNHAVECYKDLFMNPPASASADEKGLYVAKSLISLTYAASKGELTSLERLLYLAMDNEMITPDTVRVLWRIYSYESREISKKQRRGSAIILGFLARFDRNIALTGLSNILGIGLGRLGFEDLELAQHSCVILQHVVSADDWKKGEAPTRLETDHEIFDKIIRLLRRPATGPQWFGMAQEALRAINDLAQHPHAILGNLLRDLDGRVFGDNDDFSVEYDSEIRSVLLAQLIFVAGEVAIRLLVHLERCEIAFKRANANSESAAAAQKAAVAGDTSSASEDGDELKMVASTGTMEDDFVDALQEIREREVLYSDRALLSTYAKIAASLCEEGLASGNMPEMVSLAATASLAKFMCVSSIFCSDHMELLTTVIKQSTSPAIRSNLVVGMGDMAVCFNHIMDSHTDFLYGQLNDKVAVVQRTAVVTLTLLILGGQVKVKGQLSEMAKALESPDAQISGLAKMFFTELSSKENAVYNSYLDILSVLTADLSLEDAAMLRIIKFLTSFIDKDRQIKQLTDKLAARLNRAENKRQWTYTVYALKQLPGERSDELKRLLEREFTEYGVDHAPGASHDVAGDVDMDVERAEPTSIEAR